MSVQIALIRGINVGGNRMVKMESLRRVIDEAGFTKCRTFIQSGNVVFDSPDRPRQEIESLLETACADHFGFQFEFFVRRLDEWVEMMDSNPFAKEAATDPGHLLLSLAKTQFDPILFAAVEENIEGPEIVMAYADHFYTYFPVGIGTSKITRTPGWNALTRSTTARNWNTVLKLAEIGAAVECST